MSTLEEAQNKRLGKVLGALATIGVIIVIFIVALGGRSSSSHDDQTTKPVEPTCYYTWSACKDNEDLVNNYSEVGSIQRQCKTQAIKTVKYGEPRFPDAGIFTLPFDHYRPGDTFLRSGEITMIDANVLIQNMYGAMEHMEAACVYNLKTNSATVLFIPKAN